MGNGYFHEMRLGLGCFVVTLMERLEEGFGLVKSQKQSWVECELWRKSFTCPDYEVRGLPGELARD